MSAIPVPPRPASPAAPGSPEAPAAPGPSAAPGSAFGPAAVAREAASPAIPAAVRPTPQAAHPAPPGPDYTRPDWRTLEPGQRSELRIYDAESGEDTLVYATDEAVIEAPNWSADGRWFLVNRDGRLYRIPLAGGEPAVVNTGEITDFNNDHLLSPDGRFIYASSKNGHLYEIPVAGGTPRPVTDSGDGLKKRYLHGIHPDGSRLSLIAAHELGGAVRFNVYTASVRTGEMTAHTASERPHDGAEFHPDGRRLYFNAEPGGAAPGHAQLFRMDLDEGVAEQLTRDERVNWFPHLSGDGLRLLYLSYPPGTLGHPANVTVQLRLATPDAAHVRTVRVLHGGQGTINVNSWEPGGSRFAYVSYPLAAE
ncbi:TolB-like translocation protein [Mycetocola spongiae]|uniref:biopolymer transporter Tol n=1 Tax=Mycetocola spongiae TaxID=2859226 RepID=UPI001CF212E4|nr:biopolymer transporter Tol [Mycetocola spongiae]UCR88431.1 biopolymer transporter Tol [Mycetocola spongiae]